MIIGAQLYTVRDYTKTIKSFDETIKKISGMGYTALQVSAVGNIGWQNIRNVADKYNTSIIVTHTDQQRILDDTDFVIEEHKILGANYIGIGSMPDKYRHSKEGVLQFIADYKPAAQKIQKAGMIFMYHNHDFEFEKFDGKLVIDYLREGFSSDEMGFILDVFWVQAGGMDPAFLIRKLSGRLDTIHLKDMVNINGERKMVQVMEGNLNWPSIFEACGIAGVKYAFVEQDDCNGEDPFECLKTSYANLKKAGYK